MDRFTYSFRGDNIGYTSFTRTIHLWACVHDTRDGKADRETTKDEDQSSGQIGTPSYLFHQFYVRKIDTAPSLIGLDLLNTQYLISVHVHDTHGNRRVATDVELTSEVRGGCRRLTCIQCDNG